MRAWRRAASAARSFHSSAGSPAFCRSWLSSSKMRFSAGEYVGNAPAARQNKRKTAAQSRSFMIEDFIWFKLRTSASMVKSRHHPVFGKAGFAAGPQAHANVHALQFRIGHHPAQVVRQRAQFSAGEDKQAGRARKALDDPFRIQVLRTG